MYNIWSTYGLYCIDDLLTPCDDEDPEAAISTAPLLGEKDDSMVDLVLVKYNESTVSHLTNISPSVTVMLRIA